MTSVGPGYTMLMWSDSRAGAGVAPARAGTPRGRALAQPAAHSNGSAPVSQRTGAQASIDPFDASICPIDRSEEHTSELQSHSDLVCRLLLEKKKDNRQ